MCALLSAQPQVTAITKANYIALEQVVASTSIKTSTLMALHQASCPLPKKQYIEYESRETVLATRISLRLV